MKQLSLFCLFTLAILHSFAQQTYTVTDKSPALADGLEMGYTIKNTAEKAVGDKGEFSRYAIRFYVKNISAQEKIIVIKQGLGSLVNSSDELVQFNCLNATGARFTTKSAILRAEPYNEVRDKRTVLAGYSIKAGQTITTDAVVIVPLHQQPNMQAVYLAKSLQPIASAVIGTQETNPRGTIRQVFPTSAFKRIRNTLSNTYLNLETGSIRCSTVQTDWPSAQWRVAMLPGSGYYTFTNRLKANYVAIVGIDLGMSRTLNNRSSWILEPTQDVNLFRIKNAETGEFVCVIAGQVTISSLMGKNDNSIWVFE